MLVNERVKQRELLHVGVKGKESVWVGREIWGKKAQKRGCEGMDAPLGAPQRHSEPFSPFFTPIFHPEKRFSALLLFVSGGKMEKQPKT